MGKWKALTLVATLIMLVNCLAARWDAKIPAEEVVPVTAMMLSITHAVWRGPYRALRWWEWPVLVGSLALAGWGAFRFQGEGEVFFACFVVLALSYGYACTASLPDTRWRREVLEPTRGFTRYSLPFFDFGLVFAPFVFPLLALRYWWRGR